MEKHKVEKGILGWIILAVLLLSVGFLGFFSTYGTHVVSNAEYVQLSAVERMQVMGAENFQVAHYGGLCFIIAGFTSLGLAVFIRLKS